jgi:CRISPR-associated endonuclease/helicase Cas3
MAESHLAHVRQNASGAWEEHDLEAHLRAVAGLAGKFAEGFGSSEWAALAGLWHDLGKYKSEFQDYIRNVSGYHADAHLENETVPGKVDHSALGAIHAVQRHKGIGRILAYLIAGHHSGLPDWFNLGSGGRGLEERLEFSKSSDKKQSGLLEATRAGIPKDIVDSVLPTSKPPQDPEHVHLWMRMLFSSLVDADFLDTEAFMDSEKAKKRGPTFDVEKVAWRFSVQNRQKRY